MMAGKLTELLEVQDAVKEDGEFSSGAVKYVARKGYVRAELRKQRGTVRESGGEIFSAYDAEFNKDGEEVYHLRAFDAWKLQYPMCITTSGRCETSG